MNNRSWFVTCPKGLEGLLLHELSTLGAENPRETVAGCHFEGSLAVAYRTCLWSRLANRILMPLSEFAVTDSASLHRGLLTVSWPDYLPAGCSFVVDFSGESSEIRNTQYGAQVAKDAIVDQFRERGLPRPDVAKRDPDVRFQMRLHRGKISVALDMAGASLHQRGYRLEAGAAPLKENLAAALLLRADWPGIAARGGALIDPMCGAGTLLLEAAMMTTDMAPGLWRARWGFESQAWHNQSQWQALRNDAQARADKGLQREPLEIRGYDADPQVLHKAQANIQRAGLDRHVRVQHKSVAELRKPTHRPIDTGLVICNPPYGERLGEREQLPALYAQLGETLVREFMGWQAAVFTADKALGRAVGLRSHKQYALFNGALPSSLLLFNLTPDNHLQSAPQPNPEVLSAGAEMFANRLRKNLQRFDRWARKQGVSCYRVYDADMPEYAVAIDRYGSALHVAEYKAPDGIDPAAAERRLAEVQQAVPVVTGVAASDIYYKQRSRQRGTQQYEKNARAGELLAVQEGSVTVLVNLSDYLDTGLFLDHRPLRLRLGAEARGKDFLNLFCYTATASVHAARLGAKSTTSVDLSNTYLDWARKNFQANDLPEGETHRFIKADCRQWLAREKRDYDLILLDPPSFSNSKSTPETFDVQRDHQELLITALARLRPDGVLYFSNNLRSFTLDAQLANLCTIENISSATIDLDFQRNSRIHRCWRLTHQVAG